MRITWTLQSRSDLEAIHKYIAQDSTQYADITIRRIVLSVERLRDFPRSGRIVPERADPNIREVIVGPFRVVYRLQHESVQVVTVFRSSRQLPASM
jgi:plasmid stabilization system protein ParE